MPATALPAAGRLSSAVHNATCHSLPKSFASHAFRALHAKIWRYVARAIIGRLVAATLGKSENFAQSAKSLYGPPSVAARRAAASQATERHGGRSLQLRN